MMYTLGGVYEYEQNKDDPEYKKTALHDAVPYYTGKVVGGVLNALKVPYGSMGGTATEQLTRYIWDKVDGQ